MLGSKQITIDRTNFLAGMSTSDYSADAGFSNQSYGVNPQAVPGVLYGTPALTDASTNLSDKIIASCEGDVASPRLFIDQSANFYSLNTSFVLTKQWTGAKTYTKAYTDLVSFNNLFYTSSTTDVAQWNGAATHTEAWFSGLSGSGSLSSLNPHPMIVYNKLLWVCDGNAMHSVDISGNVNGGAGTGTPALVLNTNEIVMALGIDPGTGQMLISTQTKGLSGDVANMTNFIPNQRYIYLFDGASAKSTRRIPVNDLVTAFYSIGGTVFVGASQRIGIWTGAGIQFLRTLNNVALGAAAPGQLPYKHLFTNIGSTLYVADGDHILAYGELQAGGLKKFWYTYKANSTITCLVALTNNNIGVAYSTASLGYVDVTVAGPTTVFLSNRYEFPRPVALRRIRVFTTAITTTAGAGQVGIFTNESNQPIFPQQPQMIVPSALSPLYKFDFDFGGTKIQTAQFQWLCTQSAGLNRMIIYYDPLDEG